MKKILVGVVDGDPVIDISSKQDIVFGVYLHIYMKYGQRVVKINLNWADFLYTALEHYSSTLF